MVYNVIEHKTLILTFFIWPSVRLFSSIFLSVLSLLGIYIVFKIILLLQNVIIRVKVNKDKLANQAGEAPNKSPVINITTTIECSLKKLSNQKHCGYRS